MSRIGVYGWGVVAPGARNVAALERLLRAGKSALMPSHRRELGDGLFVVGDPDFTFDDYVPWIASRKGDAYAVRMRSKMGDNVLFAVGATIQALQCDERVEQAIRTLDDACHVYIGSGVGDLPQSYAAADSLAKATRRWNHFWAQPERCGALRDHLAGSRRDPEAPPDPRALPVDSEERFEAVAEWEAYWANHSDKLAAFRQRYAEVERLTVLDEELEKAHLSGIRKRMRAHNQLVAEFGCPPPPWTAVSSNLIWNIQNTPASQITMLLDVHGAAWAPVGACSTFGVALKCGRDAILRGEAKMAIVGTTDPRPDAALVGAFYEARVMPGAGDVNYPFTSLRGTHVSGGSCMWVLGDAHWCEARGLRPVGGYVEAVALSSDAEHIITPSETGPTRAIKRAYAEAGIMPEDVALLDLHATGTPGDLNELKLVEPFTGEGTRFTARKGQLGHGMANSGGWELTALALSLACGEVFPTAISADEIHPQVKRPRAIATELAPLAGQVGVKVMLGIGGITACVVMRAP